MTQRGESLYFDNKTLNAVGIVYPSYQNFVLIEFAKHTPILLTKITAAQNEVALSYHSVRGLYFLAVVFAVTVTAVRKDSIPREIFDWSNVLI